MALVDADYKFICAEVGSNGSAGDAQVCLRKPSIKECWAYLIMNLYRTTTDQRRSTLLRMTHSPRGSGY
ncbi:hypothetical protein DPMN_042953 [Dreissena polymorpha]|uniref:Uncharacterized protein n=1 Tax=Dreissena polymorpha TaxID=45954 RepID=A0A9D4HV65_DREPO|nr:hypothetical protein DPMN_042953 [Dreissena polymorpha]